MSVSLSNAFVTLFDAEVKQAYQGKAMLVPAVRQRRGVEGSTVKFPKVGKGVATIRVPQSDVTPLNVGFSSVTLTLADYNAAEYSDIFSQAKVNFDERQELVQVVAGAMGRRQDQMILDALNASSTSLTVANSIGGANTNMNIAKLREAKRLMDKNNVPPDGRNIIIHGNGLANLLSETSVTSSDFNSVKALVQVVAGAMGRRQDQMILDALNGSSTSLTVANSIGGSTTNMNIAKLREAKRLLDKGNVPPDGRHIIIHANGLSNLLSETSVMAPRQ